MLFVLCFPQIYAEVPLGDKSTRPVGTSSPHPNYFQQDSDTCHLSSETVSEKHTRVGASYPFSFLITLFFRVCTTGPANGANSNYSESCSVPATSCEHPEQAHSNTAPLGCPHLPAASWSYLTKLCLPSIEGFA